MNNTHAYKEILSVLNKHKDLVTGDTSIDISHMILNRIILEEVSSEFGIACSKNSNPGWIELSEYESIGMYGENHRRTCNCTNVSSARQVRTLPTPVGSYPRAARRRLNYHPSQQERRPWYSKEDCVWCSWRPP